MNFKQFKSKLFPIKPLAFLLVFAFLLFLLFLSPSSLGSAPVLEDEYVCFREQVGVSTVFGTIDPNEICNYAPNPELCRQCVQERRDEIATKQAKGNLIAISYFALLGLSFFYLIAAIVLLVKKRKFLISKPFFYMVLIFFLILILAFLATTQISFANDL